MKEEIKEEEFKGLPNKKVKISPIKRKGGWLPPTNAASFLFGESKIKISVPLQSKNTPKRILTKSEEEYLSKELRTDLSVYAKPSENYWLKHYVKLKEEVSVLNLNDPQQYIDYKILLSQKGTETDLIAPSAEDKLKKATYKFYISDYDYEESSGSKIFNDRMEAYSKCEKIIKGGKESMRDLLNAYYFGKPGKRLPEVTKESWLESEIGKVLNDDVQGFLAIVRDPDYDLKAFVGKALAKKAIYKDMNKYSLPEGGLIATNLDDLIVWLKDPINSTEVTKIEARIQ